MDLSTGLTFFLVGILAGMPIWYSVSRFIAIGLLRKRGIDVKGLLSTKKQKIVETLNLPTKELKERIKSIDEDEARLTKEMNALNMAIKQWWRDVGVGLDRKDKRLLYNRSIEKVEVVDEK